MTYSINAALANTRDDVFVRPVGSMERFFHLYAREHPRHFCVVAEISGDIDALFRLLSTGCSGGTRCCRPI